MLVRIEVVISTAGNDEDYLGMKLGAVMLQRPLKQMLVTFQEDLTEEEFVRLRDLQPGMDDEKLIRHEMFTQHAIKVHSIRVTRNFQH